MNYGQPLQYLPLHEARSLELQRTIGDVRKEEERKLRQGWTIAKNSRNWNCDRKDVGDPTKGRPGITTGAGDWNGAWPCSETRGTALTYAVMPGK